MGGEVASKGREGAGVQSKCIIECRELLLQYCSAGWTLTWPPHLRNIVSSELRGIGCPGIFFPISEFPISLLSIAYFLGLRNFGYPPRIAATSELWNFGSHDFLKPYSHRRNIGTSQLWLSGFSETLSASSEHRNFASLALRIF